MFDKLKLLGLISSLAGDPGRLKAAGERIQVRLAQSRLEGKSASGECRVVVNGKMDVLEVELSPAFIASLATDHRAGQHASEAIAQAVDAALTKARLALREAVSKELTDLGLSDLPILEQLTSLVR